METRLIHSGEFTPRFYGAVSLPVFQSSTFEFDDAENYHDIKYIRLNNTPNHLVLNRKLAEIENAPAAVVTSSGMAAITTSLLTVLKSGDHLLAQDCLYGGTHDFLTRDLGSFGIEFDFIDADNPSSWESKVTSRTKAIYVESLTNPLMQVGDLKAVAGFAKKNKLVSLIDNTFTSPVNFRPLEIGFDISLHSGTKYLNGHNDIVAGAVIGSAKIIQDITHKLNHLGGTLDPHACFLLHRGLKTLALRVKYQNESALRIAKFLESHASVQVVNYPGLESHPRHARAKDLFEGFSGMLSFELKDGPEAAKKLVRNLKIPVYAPSLGGVESLVTLPSTSSHAGLSAEDRKKLGISDSLIRFSVGIESSDDLIDDLNQALGGI